MTNTTITTNPTTTVPVLGARTPIWRHRAAIIAAGLALASITGTTALVGLSGSDGEPVASVERSAPAPAGAWMSADAHARWAEAEAEAYQRQATAVAAEQQAKLELSERAASSRPSSPVATPASADAVDKQAQLELSRQVAACRTSAVAPDAVEHCLARPGG